MDDYEAVARLKAGDIGGLEVLVRRYQVRALRAAVLVTRDRALAEEAVQEAFLRFYRGVQRFDASRPVAPYLFRTVVNTALNLVRREGGHVALDQAALAQVEGLLNRGESVEDEVARAMLAEEVARALDALPPRQRAAIVRRYYLDMGEGEMAEAMGVTRGTVKRLLYNARRRLRRLLGEERKP